MRVTQKLGLLVAAPLVAVVGFAALAVVTTGGAAVRADELRRLAVVSAAAGELVHRLQLERAGAVGTLSGGSLGPESFAELVGATDQAAQRYQQARADLPELPAGTSDLVERIGGQLGQLAGLRDEVTSGEGRASAIAFAYRIVVADLIGFRESVAQAGGASAEVADRLRAAAALTQAGEAVGLQQTAVLRVTGYGPLSQAALQEITAARTANLEALQTFDALASPGWRVALERAATGEEALLAQELEDRVARTPPGGRLAVDLREWTAAMSGRLQRQRQVQQEVDADILAEVTALRDAQRRQAGLQIAAVALAVAGAVALAVVLGRPVVRGLRRLRDAAHEVASRRLPDAVARLEQQQEELGGLTPEQFADQVPLPVPVRGTDELAELGSAFNIVHREAIRTAAGQTMLRVRIGEMFVNVARRGQGLHGRLTAALDDLERDELDHRRLGKLFHVDSLVTLLGRANDSLLVLGGSASARVPPEGDEPLAGVLRAAGSQVADYERVELGVVDDGLAVRAQVVDDAVLLLAELLDNACRFSPPDTAVVVNGRWLDDRVVVSVIDQGVGVSPPKRREELNRRLASRVPLDVKAVRSMGLTVVSRLAERHGIGVELRAGQPQGTIAEVSLPSALVSAAALRERPAAGHGRHGQAAVAPARPAEPSSGRVPQPRPAPDMAWPPAAPSQPDNYQLAATRGSQAALPGQGTQELPPLIYEQVRRSMWLTPSDGDTVEMAAVGDRDARAGAGTWQTPADAGWQAAARAASPQPAGVTGSGLPVRRPGAQLVPGGVGQPHPATPVATLAAPAAPAGPGRAPDPHRVSAAAAAFSRGLSTGRGQGSVFRPHTSYGTEPDQ